MDADEKPPWAAHWLLPSRHSCIHAHHGFTAGLRGVFPSLAGLSRNHHTKSVFGDQDLAVAVVAGFGDHAGGFHGVDQAGRAVVADAQLALNP